MPKGFSSKTVAAPLESDTGLPDLGHVGGGEHLYGERLGARDRLDVGETGTREGHGIGAGGQAAVGEEREQDILIQVDVRPVELIGQARGQAGDTQARQLGVGDSGHGRRLGAGDILLKLTTSRQTR